MDGFMVASWEGAHPTYVHLMAHSNHCNPNAHKGQGFLGCAALLSICCALSAPLPFQWVLIVTLWEIKWSDFFSVHASA